MVHFAKVCRMLLALGLALPTASLSQQPSEMVQAKCPDAAAAVATARKDGYVRVIVQFESPVPPGDITADAGSIAKIKARVAAAQDAIIASHFGNSRESGSGFPRGISRFDITPAFAVNVTESELEALAADSRVKNISIDRAKRPLGQ